MTTAAANASPRIDRFDEDPARSYTLPASYYTDPAIFEREKEAVFFRSWQLVGHVGQVRAAGDYFTCNIFDQHLVVIRGRDGVLRAFYNVCQHRAHRLLEGSGNAAVITCPYHAWSYDAEGPLRAAPNWRNVAGFDRKAVCLSPVQAEILCGFVFVNLDGAAPALADQAAGLAQELRDFSPNCEELVHAHRVQYPVKANWKVCAENFSECYHCRLVHPALTTEYVEMGSYRIVTHGIYQRHHVKLKPGVRPSVEVERGTNAPAHEQGSWSLWPHMAFQVVGKGYLTVFQWLPVDPDTTLFTEDWYFPGKTPTEAQWKLIRFRADFTQPEDDSVCEAVQQGLHSRGYYQGRLMIDAARSPLSEHGPHHLQLLTRQALDAHRPA